MTHRVYKVIRDRRYAYEYESYYDNKLKRTRQRMVRYLGPCDTKGRITAEPKSSIGSVHSAFPVGCLAILHAASDDLGLFDIVSSIVSKDAAKLLLCLTLNQAAARVPIYHLHEWVSASPLPKWGGLDAA